MPLSTRLWAKPSLPDRKTALPGRSQPITTAAHHFVNQLPLKGPFPAYSEKIYFAMGCFWGVERLFWQKEGVIMTAAGYMAGLTPNPTYEEVCTGRTGHAEAVMVIYDPAVISFDRLLKLFWENHDPTQGMRQGHDVGAQYRSGIYATSKAQKQAADASRAAYQSVLTGQGWSHITTEILEAPVFYYAEEYHQQYLAKNPAGYCALKGTGLACPT